MKYHNIIMQHLKGHLSVGVRGMCLCENTLILNFNKNYKMLSVTYTQVSNLVFIIPGTNKNSVTIKK